MTEDFNILSLTIKVEPKNPQKVEIFDSTQTPNPLIP
jgi:hypothetical protein